MPYDPHKPEFIYKYKKRVRSWGTINHPLVYMNLNRRQYGPFASIGTALECVNVILETEKRLKEIGYAPR